MSQLVNPYHAGRPVEKAAMFFGRDDALIWVEQQLTLDRRFLIVYGPDMIGKTSLVHRLPAFLAGHVLCLYFECKPHRGKSVSQVLAALAGRLANQLMAQGLVSPHQVDTAADSATAVKSILQQAILALDQRGSSEGIYRPLLILDDVHRLENDENFSLADLFDYLATLQAQIPSLYLLLTLSDLSFRQLNHSLMLGAETFRLGPLSSDAAQQLIIRPSQGVLRFDSGVVKRITEIASNHPYYLHLFCYTLYNSCARDGWVNQSDIDRVLDTLLSLPNKQFQAIWDQSSWAEQAALTGLAGVRGAHGPITRQEVINYLRRFNPEVVPDVIVDALESLADKGVLVRMGALSYRFLVDLFRYWLDRHTDPTKVLAGVDWNRVRANLATRSATEEVWAAEAPIVSHEGEDEESTSQRRSLGLLSILGLTGTALIGMAILALAFSGMLPFETGEPTPTSMPDRVPVGFETLVPSSSTPTSVPTPTFTRPLVVTHSLPAIVYMARGVDDNTPPFTWDLFTMDVDGTDRQQITENTADDITPVWSPDGQRVAFVTQRDGNREIYLVNAKTLADTNTLTSPEGAGLVNLTQHPSEDWTPAWSPDGQQIAFSSNRQGNWEIFIINADGTGLRQITNDGEGNLSPVWSPDGKLMAYVNKGSGNWEIYTMPAPDTQGQASSERQRLTFSEGNDLSPLFSPQGDRIAFESNREGNVEIFVMNSDGSNQQNLSNLPVADDHGPVWSPDGQRLVFYSNREGNWDLFVTTTSGESVVNLTNTPELNEQAPAWRP